MSFVRPLFQNVKTSESHFFSVTLYFYPPPPTARRRCRIALTSSTSSPIRPAARTARCGSAPRRWSDRPWRASSPGSFWSGTFTQTSDTRRKTRRKGTGLRQREENSCRFYYLGPEHSSEDGWCVRSSPVSSCPPSPPRRLP